MTVPFSTVYPSKVTNGIPSQQRIKQLIMWRLANCIYRAFRHTATHRCSQDVLVPLSTVCNTEDDKDVKKKEKHTTARTCDIYQVLKQNQFSYPNLEKLQEHLQKLSIQQILAQKPAVVKSVDAPPVEPKNVPPPPKTEETLDSLLKTDETCAKAIKELSDLHEETVSIINLEIALDALESGNYQLGIESLQASAKHRTNAAALYNLGLCYEQGIGVAHDRAKACDYYRWAASLGHTNAQLHLSRLSNHIDIDDDDEEDTLTEIPNAPSPETFFRLPSSNVHMADQSLSEHEFDSSSRAVACLS